MFSRKIEVAEWLTVFAMKVTNSLQLRVSCLAQKPLKIIISFFFPQIPVSTMRMQVRPEGK